MSVDDESFPRGGTRVIPKDKSKRKHEEALFPTTELKAKKAKKPKVFTTKETISDETFQASLKLQGTLTYNKIQSGMVILGCIRHISNLALEIEFPGLTFGHVTINCISESFTNNLAAKLKSQSEESISALRDMFTLGQIVPVKILEKKATERGNDIHGSVNPADINAGRLHNSFKKGVTVWANVLSELDHGYELSVGVKNCRVFLPFKNVEALKKYGVGEPLFCVVHKSEQSSVATTLTVSAKKEHLEKVQVEELSLDGLLPGTKVEFVVEEVLSTGIKGKFLNFFGYIDETQFFSTKLNKIHEGSTLPAHVLFTETITKVTYLTLRPVEIQPAPKHEIGKILPVEIKSISPKGLYLKLGKDEVGFVANKRLVSTLPKNPDLDISEAIKKKFTVGSGHACRILDYNRMQQLYICTLEQKVIKEKVFASSDVKIGQSVNGKVERILPSGLVVSLGHVRGFAPNLHLSNTEFSDTIKSKYHVGMSLNARVLNITEDNVIITLKQGLVESDSCLSRTDDVKMSEQYVGYVVQTKTSGALVAFYGGAKGWISNRVLNSGNNGGYVDPKDYFFRGQVVTVWTMGFKDGKLQLSLQPPEAVKRKRLKVGQRAAGTVTAVHPNSVDVEIGVRKIPATLPLSHLSHNLPLCPVLIKHFKPGDRIQRLICVKNEDTSIVSRREGLAFARNRELTVPKLSELKAGMILRCSFDSETDSGMYVYTPILNSNEKILILNENRDRSYQKDELVMAKVLKVDRKTKGVYLDARGESLGDVKYKESFDILLETLEEMRRIEADPNFGKRVQCVVQEKTEEGVLLSLPNGRGIARPHLTSRKLKIGEELEGVVLDRDFVNDRFEICLKNDLKQKVNHVQDGIMRKSICSSCKVEVLLVTKFYVLGVLKDKDCKRQLVYLPSDSEEELKEGDKIKVITYKKIGTKVVGVPKKLIQLVDKNWNEAFVKLPKPEEVEVKGEIEVEAQEESVVEISEEEVENDEQQEEIEVEESEDEDQKDSIETSVKNEDKPVFPGMNSFYDSDQEMKEEESSSEDEAEDQEDGGKKKKLTAAERKEVWRKEEERISKIEKELADATVAPQTADQFDRLLLANPNSSELWLKYMAMHVASAELEKARVVAQKALETINMTRFEEKFNVWIGLLNLENMYGTKESFESVFENATKFNDSLDIYLNVINLLASSGKFSEMEEKIKKIRNKEKQNTKMWLEVGKVYYSLGKFREARNIKEASLKSILDNKRQFDLIVRFAIMEFQSGELEQAIANFETILETYPSKINIWIVYVDQLVKKQKIEAARRVLERAASQKLPVKSMKAIFQKFITFEEQHGTAEQVEEVKTKAKGYVKSIGIR